ncbi:hypothetical protein OIU77_002879 [Salix suchowensis]|uniref:Uncharacterized protein n=1 Tax=Salix suchowensis TaxID=1278906 RepID=A0ABQ9AZ03_9ROSI|nr:hypothetical protein OIU77_002879 [Salix suchowensis]
MRKKLELSFLKRYLELVRGPFPMKIAGRQKQFMGTVACHQLRKLKKLASESPIHYQTQKIEEPYDDSSSEASISGSLKSSEIGEGVDEDHFLSQLEGFDHQKQTNCHELSTKSTESEEFAGCVVEDSEEGNSVHDDQVANDSPSSSLAASIDAVKTTEKHFAKGPKTCVQCRFGIR